MPYLLYQFVNRGLVNSSKEESERTYESQNLPMGVILQIFISLNKNLSVI